MAQKTAEEFMHSSDVQTGQGPIIILGSGFAGAYCAQKLEKLRRKLGGRKIILIDRHNYFIFYPLLIEAGTGSLQPNHAIVPIRSFLKRTEFMMADVVGINAATSTVRVQVKDEPEPREMRYEHLVLSLGSVSNTPDVPGLREHGYTMKSLVDAVSLRDRAIHLLERANLLSDKTQIRSLLRLVVVGGNYTGVETAGEYQEYLTDAARHYPNIAPEDCGVTLVDRGDRLLSTLAPQLSEWATIHLKRRGIDVRLKESVSEIHRNHVVLRSGETLQTHTVIWCAGIAPTPLAKRLGLETDSLGYILCDRDLRVKGHRNLWAIGDCAVNPGPNGKPYPATAQNAVQQGLQCAKNLALACQNQPTENCDIHSRGELAAFGRFDAVAVIMGWRFTGFIAWFLWRTVYLLKMPGWTRSARVALDWTIDLLFGRDYAELGVHRNVHPFVDHSVADHVTPRSKAVNLDGAAAEAIKSPPAEAATAAKD